MLIKLYFVLTVLGTDVSNTNLKYFINNSKFIQPIKAKKAMKYRFGTPAIFVNSFANVTTQVFVYFSRISTEKYVVCCMKINDELIIASSKKYQRKVTIGGNEKIIQILNVRVHSSVICICRMRR